MKKFLNNTILRDLHDYKITNRESGNVTYLPSNSLQAFLKMQAGKTHKYKFEEPATRKANRICGILDRIAMTTAITFVCWLSIHFLTI
jgi:hypothetical protein